MSTAAHGLLAVARRVIARQVASAPLEELAASIEQVFGRLHLVTATMVGDLGYLALQARAVGITRGTHRWLPIVPVPLSPSLSFAFPGSGWQTYVDQEGADEVLAGARLLLANVLTLMASFISEDFTFRLVGRAWPDEDPAADGSDPRET
jgi:hypothetical protein